MDTASLTRHLLGLPALRAGIKLVRKVESRLGDWWLNIDTGAPHYFQGARGINQDAFDFETNAHASLLRVIGMVRPGPDDVVFVVGCGRGRAVCHFARLPVRRVVGLELDPGLCRDARKNVATLRGRRAEVELRLGDAALADVSAGTVFYLFNPFGAQTLRMLLGHIVAANTPSTRSITLVYAHPLHAGVLSEYPLFGLRQDCRSAAGLRVLVFDNRHELSRAAAPGRQAAMQGACP